MKIIGFIKKIFFCLWAISVLWIMIGSLVNFHQHKIWGKPLLSQFMINKREQEHSPDIAKLLISKAGPESVSGTGILPGDFQVNSNTSVQYLYCTTTQVVSPVVYFFSSGLRAPPVS